MLEMSVTAYRIAKSQSRKKLLVLQAFLVCDGSFFDFSEENQSCAHPPINNKNHLLLQVSSCKIRPRLLTSFRVKLPSFALSDGDADDPPYVMRW
jgi:hypothetical protein